MGMAMAQQIHRDARGEVQILLAILAVEVVIAVPATVVIRVTTQLVADLLNLLVQLPRVAAAIERPLGRREIAVEIARFRPGQPALASKLVGLDTNLLQLALHLTAV